MILPGSGESAEVADYAALNAVYGALLAALVLSTRDRAASSDPIQGREIVPMGAASFALAKFVARERIGSWVRDPFVDEGPAGPRPRGERMRRAIGELVTCTRCVGAWSAIAVVGLRLASPSAGRTVIGVLATSATNDFLQAAFRWLCAQANDAEADPSRKR